MFVFKKQSLLKRAEIVLCFLLNQSLFLFLHLDYKNAIRLISYDLSIRTPRWPCLMDLP